tara:strand:- start:112 stop:315 length:204 start_codon:yes stop_codon:yes gene_type:complete
MKTELLWELIIVMIVVGTVFGIAITTLPNKELSQNKCIDGTLYQLTDQGYALAYNQKCKVLTKKDTT